MTTTFADRMESGARKFCIICILLCIVFYVGMTVRESCGFDCHPALYAGEHSMAAELSSTLPVHWDYLIHDANFQTRPYVDFWGNECAH